MDRSTTNATTNGADGSPAPAPPAAAIEASLHRIFPRRRIERVLLVQPPDADEMLYDQAAAKRFRYSVYPPYGLLMLARHVLDAGLECRVVDLNRCVVQACFEAPPGRFSHRETWTTALDRAIDEFQPDLVGVTCMFTMTHEAFAAICRHVGARGIPLAVGGVHVTNNAAMILEELPVVDLIFTHEADESLVDFLAVVNGRSPIEKLAQVILAGRGLAAGEPPIRLDRFHPPCPARIGAVPAYHLVDIGNYSHYGVLGQAYFLSRRPRGGIATCLANRGCRGHCKFCSVRSFNGAGVRARPIESVLDELELLRRQYGIRHIMWLDDDLFYDARRTIRLFRALAERKLDLTWDATNGLLAAACTEEVLDAAVVSGCIALTVGVESGNPRILKEIRKPATVEVCIRAGDVLQRFPQVWMRTFLMLGFPGETFRMLGDTVRLALRMNFDWNNLAPLQILPGTELAGDDAVLNNNRPAREVRYLLNNYGRTRECPERRLAFEGLFSRDDLLRDHNIAEVWFVVNYLLNFQRIFGEPRPEKQAMILEYLRHIVDYVSPAHAFALYFSGFLEWRLHGAVPPRITEQLRQKLQAAEDWQPWFEGLGLSLRHLEEARFPGADPEAAARQLAMFMGS